LSNHKKLKAHPILSKKLFLQDLNLPVIPFGKPKGTSKCHDATMRYSKVSILNIEFEVSELKAYVNLDVTL
jgi:hypothetical protein